MEEANFKSALRSVKSVTRLWLMSKDQYYTTFTPLLMDRK